jgi:hypothetical protein
VSEQDDVPRYRQNGFMARELSLYHVARIGARLAQRNGNDDEPIRPIAGIAAIRRIRPTRGMNPIDDVDQSA